jgi:hypothetical protein
MSIYLSSRNRLFKKSQQHDENLFARMRVQVPLAVAFIVCLVMVLSDFQSLLLHGKQETPPSGEVFNPTDQSSSSLTASDAISEQGSQSPRRTRPTTLPFIDPTALSVSKGANILVNRIHVNPPAYCHVNLVENPGGRFPFSTAWTGQAQIVSNSSSIVCPIPPLLNIKNIGAASYRFPFQGVDFGKAHGLAGLPVVLVITDSVYTGKPLALFPLTLFTAGDDVSLEDPLGNNNNTFARASSSCPQTKLDSLTRLLTDTQFPRACGRTPYMRHGFRRTGLGVNIVNHLMRTVRDAMRFHSSASAPLVLPFQTPDEWSYGEACNASTAYACLFGAVSSCKLSDLNSSLEVSPRGENVASQTVLTGAFNGARFTAIVTHPFASPLDRLNPWLHDCGTLRVYSSLVAFFTPTREDLRDIVAKRMDLLKAGPVHEYQCIAVHIRQGERGSGGDHGDNVLMPRYQLVDILNLLRPLAKSLHTRNVVLITDGTHLLQEAVEYNGTDIEFFTNHDVKRAVDGQDCLRESRVGCSANLTPEEVRLALILDLEALNGCKYFVGTLKSSFAKLAYLRGLGRGVIVNPPISFD